MKSLVNSDDYIVFCPQLFHTIDYSALSLLYSPIIGVNAITLYLQFHAEHKIYSKNEHVSSKHSRIFSINNFDIKTFLEARCNLECLGLLKTLFKKGNSVNSFIYILYPPLSPETFFENEILNSLLKEKLTATNLQKTKSLLLTKPINTKNYVDISTKLSENYEFKCKISQENAKNWAAIINSRKKKHIFKINLAHIKKTLEILKSAASFYNSKSLEDYLTKCNLILNLSNEEIAREFNLISQELRENSLTFQIIQNHFDGLVKKFNVRNILKEKQITADEFKSNKLLASIKAMECQSIESFYVELFKKQLDPELLNTIDYFIEDYKIQPGVINSIFYYIKLNNKTLSKPYFETIIETILKAATLNREYKTSAFWSFALISSYKKKKTKPK